MARYKQADNVRYIEANNGFGWICLPDGKRQTEVFGMVYELERRARSRKEPGSLTGWHLYSVNHSHFFGEFCDRTLLWAVDVASEIIAKTDLRGEGYEKEEA